MLFNRTVQHTEAFDIKDVTGVDAATREILQNVFTDRNHEFEALAFKSAAFDGGDATKQMNETVGFNEVSHDNPAGTYRVGFVPKQLTEDWEAIKTLGDIRLEAVYLEQAILSINTPKKTPSKLIYPQDKGWLYANIEAAVQGQNFNAMTSKFNYDAYKQIKEGAVYAIDPILGKSPRVREQINGLDKIEFTDQLISDLESYYSLPEHKFTYGLDPSEVVLILDPVLGHAKLLQAKLVIYDGQAMGDEGKFYNGLPKTLEFAGHPAMKSRWLNAPQTSVEDRVCYITLSTGRFGAYAADIPIFDGHAEVVLGTGKALMVYSTIVYGSQVIDLFTDLIGVGFNGINGDVPWAGYNIQNVIVGEATTDSIKFKAVVTSPDATSKFLYKVVDATVDQNTVSWSEEDLTMGDTELALEAKSLTSKTAYKIIYAVSSGGSTPIVDSKTGKQFVQHIYTRTK